MIEGAVGLLELFAELLGFTAPEQPANVCVASIAAQQKVTFLAKADRRTRKPPWNPAREQARAARLRATRLFAWI